MKIKRKNFEKILAIVAVYEVALEDIALLAGREGNENQRNEWLSRTRQKLAVNALKTGMEIEKSA